MSPKECKECGNKTFYIQKILCCVDCSKPGINFKDSTGCYLFICEQCGDKDHFAVSDSC